MRAPLGWLREYAALPDDLDGRTLAEALIRAGLEVETVDQAGADVTGPAGGRAGAGVRVEDHAERQDDPLVPGRRRPHNDDSGSRRIVCGAHNFEVGDFVVVALPGPCCPGGSPSPPARPTATSPTG